MARQRRGGWLMGMAPPLPTPAMNRHRGGGCTERRRFTRGMPVLRPGEPPRRFATPP
ncbi:MAG: hypothetical protein U1F76_00020 [Candidatus Competibacteraceae bacterium]